MTGLKKEKKVKEEEEKEEKKEEKENCCGTGGNRRLYMRSSRTEKCKNVPGLKTLGHHKTPVS